MGKKKHKIFMQIMAEIARILDIENALPTMNIIKEKGNSLKNPDDMQIFLILMHAFINIVEKKRNKGLLTEITIEDIEKETYNYFRLFPKLHKNIGKLGYKAICLGNYDFKAWCTCIRDSLENFFVEKLGWDEEDITEFLLAIWRMQYCVGEEYHTIKEWAVIEKERTECIQKDREDKELTDFHESKTYYVTDTSPLIFATVKTEKVTERTIEQMLLMLLKREFEIYEPQDAVENLNLWLREDSAFRSWGTPLTIPTNWEEKEMPKEQEMWDWMVEFLYSTEAGSNLLNQVGQPLIEANVESREYLNDKTTLSDMLEAMTR